MDAPGLRRCIEFPDHSFTLPHLSSLQLHGQVDMPSNALLSTLKRLEIRRSSKPSGSLPNVDFQGSCTALTQLTRLVVLWANVHGTAAVSTFTALQELVWEGTVEHGGGHFELFRRAVPSLRQLVHLQVSTLHKVPVPLVDRNDSDPITQLPEHPR